MKSMILVALAFVAVAAAAPADPATSQIVRSSYEQKPEGNYEFGFETDQGMNRQEAGQLKEALDEDNKPHPVIAVRGSYSYINPEGKPETVNYYADETGFHAEGDSIPKPVRR